jgi:hypothetical protein
MSPANDEIGMLSRKTLRARRGSSATLRRASSFLYPRDRFGGMNISLTACLTLFPSHCLEKLPLHLISARLRYLPVICVSIEH